MSAIRKMVLNPVAANMLMLLVLAGGAIVAVWQIPRELFPEFSLDLITVTVEYPGASPADVEEGIILRIEDYLANLEDVKEITASSREGFGTVTLELEAGADVRRVLDEVKSEIDRIDLPEDAEDPVTVEVTLRRQVVNVAVAVSRDVPDPNVVSEAALRDLAEEIRDEINDLSEVSQVSVAGVRDIEIIIEVSEEDLRRYELTLARVADAIRNSSFDLPAGNVKTQAGELAIRVVGQRDTAEGYRDIVILSKADGTVVRLEDVARVYEGFADVDVAGQFNGRPAALVQVFKTSDEDSIEISRAVREYVQRKRSELPASITLDVWGDYSKLIQDRLDLLVNNGLWGLMLVFLILWFFLGVRLSFWVAMGIPFSILGTILVMLLTGQTLNMMSMFALILTLGLIVDDAIVVGENVFSRVEEGEPPRDAAVEGTRQVLLPVVAAVMTTWIAFVPLLFIAGVFGKFMRILPIVVITALGFSLIECLLILPPHLAHSLRAKTKRAATHGRAMRGLDRMRRAIDAGVQWFIQVAFARAFRVLTRYRYVTVSAVLAILLMMLSAVRAGFIPVTFFPKDMDSDTLRAQVTLQTGAPFARTQAVAQRVTEAALQLNEQFQGADGQPVVQRVYALVGSQEAGPGGGSAGSHLLEVTVELTPTEQRGRGVNSQRLIQQWRANTGSIPDAVSSQFGSFRGGPGGQALEARLLGPTTDYVKPAAEALREHLAGFPGVTDIRDDALPGKMEVTIALREGAEALGIDLRMLASQLRNAFYGSESVKIQRGRDEIKVRVRYPENERRSFGDIENLRVRTAEGDEVPFLEVAQVDMRRGYTTLRRVNQDSAVTVSADVDEDVTNAEQILLQLEGEGGFFQRLLADYPELTIDLGGQRQQAAESFGSLGTWYVLALLGIYTILAALFKSYFQPVIIMIAIPFGLVGAVVGHWIMGYDLTLLSMFGMVALTGIVVNDSLVLIDQINRRVRSDQRLLDAVEYAARSRFRPILLTTATTVAGIAPLLAEPSFQAQFLKPMAVAIAFGLMFATALTLLVVPSMYLIGDDVKRAARWLILGRWEPRAPATAPDRE